MSFNGVACPHYYEGYPYDYAVLANGIRMCGFCYLKMCAGSKSALTEAIGPAPTLETDYTDYTAITADMRRGRESGVSPPLAGRKATIGSGASSAGSTTRRENRTTRNARVRRTFRWPTRRKGEGTWE